VDNSIFIGNRYESWKFELLSLSGGEYIHSDWITNYVNEKESNININFSRKTIGNCKIKLNDNIDINYVSDRIKIYYCLDNYEFPLGVYMPLTPPRHIEEDDSITRNILGYGLLKALDDNKVEASYTISSGTVITTAIKTVLDTIGSWVIYNIEPCDETLPYDKVWLVGTSKLEIINSLLNMINYYPIWASGNGVYRAIPWSDIKNITYTFNDDEDECIYTNDIYENKDYAGMFNRVILIANELSTSANLYKSWSMEDEGIEDHPFSYSNINRYVDKRLFSEASSQEYLNLRAKREIRKALELEEPLSFSHGFVTSRENDGLPYQGDHYTFINKLMEKSATYKIESMNWQLDINANVESTIRRVTTP
jgi:hypothetical protein